MFAWWLRYRFPIFWGGWGVQAADQGRQTPHTAQAIERELWSMKSNSACTDPLRVSVYSRHFVLACFCLLCSSWIGPERGKTSQATGVYGVHTVQYPVELHVIQAAVDRQEYGVLARLSTSAVFDNEEGKCQKEGCATDAIEDFGR
ncbi:hypothetical protein MGG_17530 [Pyricularia oryzae 70-15]|uniref:Uncharacterized protein n=1 Tax=Pyricularia oryzae (strain 70-15 / ATCC MYA-4617 / FGSC 8958) TaxID=242507 RepID=G4NEF7_PYRO7|nr:uncharacterized protein MGG_17530 [Pyricularia oryzae 70-15]EHA49434.1 hypothetical protein MGG_17530 [Pyricularia oryzae 70-15]